MVFDGGVNALVFIYTLIQAFELLENPKAYVCYSLELSAVLDCQTQDSLHLFKLLSVKVADISAVVGVNELDDAHGFGIVDVLGSHLVTELLKIPLDIHMVLFLRVYFKLLLGKKISILAKDRAYHEVSGLVLICQVVHLILEELALRRVVADKDLLGIVDLTSDADIIRIRQYASLLELLKENL